MSALNSHGTLPSSLSEVAPPRGHGSKNLAPIWEPRGLNLVLNLVLLQLAVWPLSSHFLVYKVEVDEIIWGLSFWLSQSLRAHLVLFNLASIVQ